MRFNIRECDLYGIKNPFLFFSGWVESSVVKIEIKNEKDTLYEIEFKPTKSKTHSFSVRTEIKGKLVDKYRILAIEKDGHVEELTTFESTPWKRFAQKFQRDKLKDFKKEVIRDFPSTYSKTGDPKNVKDYYQWIAEYERFSPVETYKYNPKFSVIIPVYNVSRKYLTECLESILNQTYQNFEICLADDCSTNSETIQTLKEFEKKDSRIHVFYRETNGHISEASNSALSIATGDYIVMMDNDDVIVPQAFNEFVRVLNEDPEIDFIYSDEDKIDTEGNRSDPQFKPELAIDKLYGGNYICHLNAVRKTIMDEIGGFRKGYEGAQDFDLFLRITEVTKKFRHVPKILYHWRMIPGSTALDSGSKNYAGEAGRSALQDLLNKKGVNAEVNVVIATNYSVEYFLEEEPIVNVVVPIEKVNDDFLTPVKTTAAEMFNKQLIFTFVCDKNDYEKVTSKVVDFVYPHKVVQIEKTLAETLNKVSDLYEYTMILRQGTIIYTFDAIELMSGYSMQNEIGVVGTKILNKNKYIVDSGYFLENETLLPLTFVTYREDFGVYGTLLVPNNYRILEDVCFMFNKETLNAVNGFANDIDLEDIYYDFMLRVHESGMRNICLSDIEAQSKKSNTRHDLHKSTMMHWKQQGIDVASDMYYNENLSTQAAYRLDIKK